MANSQRCGEVAEWLKAPLSKSGIPINRDRGFESHPLRQDIEDPSSKPEGIFDRKERCHFLIRSLTPQQATGNALAIAVQRC